VSTAILFLGLAADAAAQDTRLLVYVTDYQNQLLPGARIEVHVENTNQVLAKVTAGAQGTASISVKPFRSYSITASFPEHVFFGPTVAHPAPGDNVVWLRLNKVEYLPPPDEPPAPVRSGELSGVITSEGVALADVDVEVAAGYTSFRTITLADGSYRVAVPPGTYVVRAGGPHALAPMRALASSGYSTYKRRESFPVQVLSGYRSFIDLELTPGERLLSVNVLVIDGAGQPVPDAEVEARGRRDTPMISFVQKRKTDERGSVTLGPMMQGPVTITAKAIRRSSPQMATTSIHLRDTLLDEVTVQLEQGATLSGQVEFRDLSRPMQSGRGLRVVPATPGFAASYSSIDSGLMDPTGKFTLDGLIGERCLRVDGLPPGWRLRDITHEGRDITNRILRFESGDAYTDVLIRIVPGEAPQGPPPDCQP
jgi:hypothetical protein